MEINLIVAMDEKRNIGKDNKLLWDIKEDLQLFKQFTENNIVIMGRNTYQSIGKPLPKRMNIVLTKNSSWLSNLDIKYIINGKLFIYNSIEVVLRKLKKYLNIKYKIFVIGGSQVYKEFLDKGLVDNLYISFVKGTYNGNVKFPLIDYDKWELVEEKDFDKFIFRKYKKLLDK